MYIHIYIHTYIYIYIYICAIDHLQLVKDLVDFDRLRKVLALARVPRQHRKLYLRSVHIQRCARCARRPLRTPQRSPTSVQRVWPARAHLRPAQQRQWRKERAALRCAALRLPRESLEFRF